jgi:hypothetical protein
MQDIQSAQQIAIVAVQIVADLASHGMRIYIILFIDDRHKDHSKALQIYS